MTNGLRTIMAKKTLNSRQIQSEIIVILNDGGKLKKDITDLIQESYIVTKKKIDYAIRILTTRGHLGKGDNLLDMRVNIYYLTNKGRSFYERVLL